MRLVLVEWVDSHIAVGGWKELDEIESVAPLARSVGWIVSESAEAVAIVPHLIDQQGCVVAQGCGEMLIPVRSVVKMIDLQAATPSDYGHQMATEG